MLRGGGDGAGIQGDPPLARAMADSYEAEQRRGHPLLDGAEDSVRQTASAGYRLGLLTNGPADIQRLKLERTGLAELFDAVVISAEAGSGKPSPGSLHLVVDRLGTRPGETVMVGDNWARDVEGARAAGLRAIWVSGGRARPEQGSGAATVSSVAEVPTMLAL